MPLLLIICQGSMNKLCGNVAHVQIFCQDLLAHSVTDPNGHGLFGDCLNAWVLEFFSIFSVVFFMLGRHECSSISSDTRPALKRECHSKIAVRPKECSPKASWRFQGFGSGFTELHAELDAATLLDFAIHHRHNETRSLKNTCVRTCSQHDVTWQTDAIGLWKCDHGHPSHLFSPRQLNNNRLGTFRYTSYMHFIIHFI
jgi:hypothetical protein